MKWHVERCVRLLAGTIVLLGLALSLIYNRWWLLLTAWAGFNLFQSAFTGFCLPEIILKKLGVKEKNQL